VNGLSSIMRVAAVLFILSFAAAGRVVAGDDSPPASNLARYQLLVREIADSAGTALADSGSSVAVMYHPGTDDWIVSGPVSAAWAPKHVIGPAPGARYVVEWTTTEMRVAYEAPRRDGLFGERKVDRMVSVRALITIATGGNVRGVFDLVRTSRDTIPMALIPRLEEASIPSTHGTAPEEDFFTWIAEPLIVLGAIGVSVYLLFHVRS
jgi:hypothetical protein